MCRRAEGCAPKLSDAQLSRTAAFPQRVRQGLPWIVAAQRLVGVAAEEWLKGYGCHWSLQRCIVRLLLVDALDIFGSDLRVRHLLGRPLSCRRIHM
ncbi:hypothetical protein TcBrA4_0066050 [Trypanosoma cruzi]|nr:hypothetical protein TcBrA4_0066050 [Trypanosoma cruzi]